jgi:ribonuclease Z
MFGEHRFLVDCGEGTQRQILTSGIGFKRLNHILITHSHLDHILGVAGLLSTFSRWESIDELNLYGGQAALDRIDSLIYGVVLRGAKSPMPINFHPLKAGPFFEAGDLTITALPVRHRGPDCFCYIFEQKGRRPFLPEKAEALEIPPGPWRRDLVNDQPVTLPDGRVIEPDQVLGEFRPGARLVITGDIGETSGLLEACRDADLLVCESTYIEKEADMARHFGHLTARQAAELARDAGVGQLVLTHLSRRYREKDVLQEAQAIFPETVVARDFDVYRVKRS